MRTSKIYPTIFIVGPTCSGKSEISFLLAQKTKAEIIYCDSVAVYKEINILSAKPPKAFREEIAHHQIDIVSAQKEYNAFMYFKDAIAAIHKLQKQKRNSIVTGGSGLYMKALLDGIFEGVTKDDAVRSGLEQETVTKGLDALYARLREIDPNAAMRIARQDKTRIIRALEVYALTQKPISMLQKKSQGLYGTMPIRIFGIFIDRASLYERINQRTHTMVKDGAIEEVKKLLLLGLSSTAEKVLGIKEIKGYIDKRYSLETARDELAKNTRHFAKRQMTWFRKDKRVEWIDCTHLSAEKIVHEIISRIKHV